jgi:hypothetical protein
MMAMLSLFQLLNQIHPLSEDIQQYLLKHLKQKRLKAGDTWLREGQVCLNVAFIEEGLLKSVYQKNDRVFINWKIMAMIWKNPLKGFPLRS